MESRTRSLLKMVEHCRIWAKMTTRKTRRTNLNLSSTSIAYFTSTLLLTQKFSKSALKRLFINTTQCNPLATNTPKSYCDSEVSAESLENLLDLGVVNDVRDVLIRRLLTHSNSPSTKFVFVTVYAQSEEIVVDIRQHVVSGDVLGEMHYALPTRGVQLHLDEWNGLCEVLKDEQKSCEKTDVPELSVCVSARAGEGVQLMLNRRYFGGALYYDIRFWKMLDESNPDQKPTKGGVALKPAEWQLLATYSCQINQALTKRLPNV